MTTNAFANQNILQKNDYKTAKHVLQWCNVVTDILQQDKREDKAQSIIQL